MKTKLKSVTSFVAVAPGRNMSLPHGLNSDEKPVVPEEIIQSIAGDFRVTADDTNITVENNGSADVDVDVLCTYYGFDRLCNCFSFDTRYMGNKENWCYWSTDYPDEGSCGPFDSEEEAVAHASEGHECP